MTTMVADETEGFFAKLANEVLQAAEHIVTRFDEGASVLLHGKLPDGEGSNNADSDARDFDMNDENDPLFDEDMAGSPLEGIAESVLGDILGGQVGPQTPMEHFHAFRAAINWSEPFILSLIAFHVIVFILCMWASRPSRSLVPRVALMITIGILVRSAERLNEYAAYNWEQFATQNYFDSKGVFMAIFLCGPLLLDSFLMLVIFLREASQLLIQVKTMELKQKEEAKKRNREKNEESKKED